MSIEAINWALKHARIPTDRRDSSSLAVVLIGLADHADPEGRNAFPSLTTLTVYTRLSERSVRYALRNLEQLGLIRSANPMIVAAHVRRDDRRPNGYDLAVAAPSGQSAHRKHRSSSNTASNAGHSRPHAGSHEGRTEPRRAANNAAARGNPAPEPSMRHPLTTPDLMFYSSCRRAVNATHAKGTR
ncbi:helix-turn-helix domain-containing protein [Amycolatopsis rubida]|uniref:Helix-turn-helix domain-containing protein n=1 Tax=Amycolatopsis rubida TaxID=112413 RepID=A0ABX0BYF9_9PSEU|nr:MULTISPECIES: helix-turn-helix domain-containing protein [Amycolatopsis]MYW94200.1 hypothetical protein [Amycolatopsis rubida]NEC59189.1 helix-turn-helix domain-containing protein [Amycolatopsis rubida]OAP20869.1 hypothetical protein A4R44_08314 [Amycolatopsis sp. M39]